MKHLKLFGTAVLLSMAFLFSSCDNDGYSVGDIARDYVTTNVDSDGTVTFTGDSWGTMWPGTPLYPNANFKQGQRAIMYFNPLYDDFQGYDVAIKVENFIPVLTKQVEEMTAENAAEYGDDPVRITDAWIGGGFMNLIFKQSIPTSQPHRVSLVIDTRKEQIPDGYLHLEYRYNTYGDAPSNNYVLGTVSYNLNTLDLSNMKGIKMRINSAVNGNKILTFNLKSQPTPKSINEITTTNTYVK